MTQIERKSCIFLELVPPNPNACTASTFCGGRSIPPKSVPTPLGNNFGKYLWEIGELTIIYYI